MSRIHVLTAGSPDNYQVIVHAPTPGGNNSASVLWSDALKNAGLAVTTMEIGTGPGQITSSEATLVSCGAVIETTFPFQDNPTWLSSERTAALNAVADTAVAETLSKYGSRLKYFGATVA